MPGKSSGPRLSRNQAKIIIKALNANDIATVESELDKGMDINSTLYGGTLLTRAANLGKADMVKMFISRGADLNYKNRNGEGALSVGMSNSRHWKQVVPTLVKAGIIIDEKTPVWKMAFKTKKGKLLPEARETLKLLFANGASPDCYTGKKKTTVIMYYAKKGWLNSLRFFLDHGADVNAKTTDGHTALSMALTKPRRPERAAQKRERQEILLKTLWNQLGGSIAIPLTGEIRGHGALKGIVLDVRFDELGYVHQVEPKVKTKVEMAGMKREMESPDRFSLVIELKVNWYRNKYTTSVFTKDL